MRRILGSLVMVALLLSAAPAAASPPVHSSEPLPPARFAAGEVCPFAIEFGTTTERSKQTTFAVKKDGSQRFLDRGFAAGYATNLDTGMTIDSRGGYMISVVVDADGSVRADAHGRFFAYYFPGDRSDIGVGLFAVRGHVTERYSPDGTLIGTRTTGRVTDLCAAWAPA
jgi:hypothetical protein